MIFCDVGNSSFDYFDNGLKIKKELKIDSIIKDKKVFYICVNDIIIDEIRKYPNWVDLEPYVKMPKDYDGLGIDRKVISLSLSDALIIDAGSAITIDKVKNNEYECGFIYPGVFAMKKAYKNISNRLAFDFNFEVNFNLSPKNTKDAISLGFLLPLYYGVMSLKENLPIYLSGGDAKILSKVFKDAIIDESLIFKGMKKVYEGI